jgi:hypothetical protein
MLNFLMFLRRHVKFWYLEYSRSAKYKVGQTFSLCSFALMGYKTMVFSCVHTFTDFLNLSFLCVNLPRQRTVFGLKDFLWLIRSFSIESKGICKGSAGVRRGSEFQKYFGLAMLGEQLYYLITVGDNFNTKSQLKTLLTSTSSECD